MVNAKLSPIKHNISGVMAAKDELGKPGIFVLYKTNLGSPAFVGRADNTLLEALMGYRNHSLYKYYKFMACRNADEAYLWECIYWHSGTNSLDNGPLHHGRLPQPPTRSTMACPFPGCTYVHEMPAARHDMDANESEPVHEMEQE